MNYEQMSDFEINKAVATHESLIVNESQSLTKKPTGVMVNDIVQSFTFDPCNNPSDAWPIIFENEMSIWAVSETDYEIGMSYSTGGWKAYCLPSIDGESDVSDDGFEHQGQNPLRAAMICFLKMKDAEK